MTEAVGAPSILYVITDLLTGGVPLHLHRLCRAMRERGFRPEVASLATPGPVSGMLADDGFTVHHANARGPLDLRVFPRLAGLIRRRQPELIHAFLFHANIAARITRTLARYPADRLLCEIQTVEIERPWHLFVDGMTQAMCRCVIGNSPSVVAHLAERAHIESHRLALVRGGIDPTTIDTASRLPRRHWGLPEEVPLVLWVGRLDPVKGLEDLIAAMSRVLRVSPGHLVLAGDGEYRSRVEECVRALQVEPNVTLLGRRGDVASLLKSADLFVFPSYTEGLPNAILEAMAAGLPIITTDVPGCRDLIAHERTGLVVPPRDAEALSAAMLRLIADRPLGRALADAAREAVATQWSIRATYDAYEALYRSVIRASAAGSGRHADR